MAYVVLLEDSPLCREVTLQEMIPVNLFLSSDELLRRYGAGYKRNLSLGRSTLLKYKLSVARRICTDIPEVEKQTDGV
jgi:hypothetical protein